MGEFNLVKVFEAMLSDFVYHSVPHVLVAEHSTISAAAKAAGCGARPSIIDIRSHVTGRVVRYTQTSISRMHGVGEILSWEFHPQVALSRLPKMRLLNDSCMIG
jgi:hypothetical protein